MKTTKISMTIFTLAFIAHCATPPKIVDTQALKGKTAAEREQVYKDNAITVGGMFSPFKVGQAPFPGEALSPLFEAPYAGNQTKNLYSSGNTWNTVATIFAAGGGFMLGYNIGTALRGADTNVGLWVGGGATLILGFVFGGVAAGKYADASNLYNNDLFKALELQQKISAVKPQEQFPHYTVGMQQAF